MYMFIFRFYVLKDINELFEKATYLNRLRNLFLYLPVSFFLAYFALYYLLPNYILKGRWIALLLIVAGLCSLLLVFSFLITPLLGIRIVWDIPMNRETIVRETDFTVHNVLVYPLTVSGFAIGIKMAKDWYLKQKENEQLAEQKIKKEIELMKSQIHPRFLFHSLDAVYNDTLNGFAKSPGMLLKLSDLLSYLLYESNEEKVPLEKELTITEDYLELEKLSCDETLQLTINNNIHGCGKLIAPLILLTIIECVLEQAYLNKKEKIILNLQMDIKENYFYFDLTLETKPAFIAWELKNHERLLQVQKRLQVMYPDRHFFKTEAEEERLTISVCILLDSPAVTTDLITEKITAGI